MNTTEKKALCVQGRMYSMMIVVDKFERGGLQ
jgi:hypothetical protein